MRIGTTLYVIRHGETDWNAALRYQGQRDIPLNESGRVHARRNGEALRSLIADTGVVDFVASPMTRAIETMEIVRETLGLPRHGFTTDARLREVHYGHWEGHLAADLPKLDPEGLKARAADPFHWRPRGGETYAELMARTSSWLREVERDTVVVAHGGVSRTLRGALLDLDPASIPRLDVPHDRILILRHDNMAWL